MESCCSPVGLGSLGQALAANVIILTPAPSEPPSRFLSENLRADQRMFSGGRRGARRDSSSNLRDTKSYGQTTESWLRIAELAKPLASALCSRGTWEMEKSKERASLRQIQFKEYKRGLRQL